MHTVAAHHNHSITWKSLEATRVILLIIISLVCLFFILTKAFAGCGGTSAEEDPIKATQSPVVKVERDYEPKPETYPSQPKYKIDDTTRFATKKPIGKEEVVPAAAEKAERKEREKKWFFWF
ncbi:MAG: hypothetical protein PHE61_05165 [Candidatus Omnitrophica bacterium]|nr:hypothetical protein [Candidatus Omnitrophota bacterium]